MPGGSERPSAPAPAASHAQPVDRAPPDPEALLCALVLAPDTWSRNRFFRMYEAPSARRARRRAFHVRSVLGHLRRRGGDLGSVLPEPADDGEDVSIAFEVPELGLTRHVRLAPLELALVRYALAVGDEAARSRDRDRVERCLARLLTSAR
jgi:hypothetical protein